MLANFIKQRFAIVCLQETRSKNGRARMVDNVVMLASTADKGNYGCEVWVNLASPVGVKSGKKIFLTRDGVTAVYSDPRILIVKCRTTKIEMYIISAHAPYCKSPTDCREACEWWVKFSSIVSTTCSKDVPVLIGIDANYVVHNDASSGIGEVCRIGVPPPHHSSVCEFLNNLSFSVFNSFSDLLGDKFTRGVPSYIPKRGSFEDAICIDHFIGSSNVVCKTGSIAQCSELGHVQAADDHIPIAVFVPVPCC